MPSARELVAALAKNAGLAPAQLEALRSGGVEEEWEQGHGRVSALANLAGYAAKKGYVGVITAMRDSSDVEVRRSLWHPDLGVTALDVACGEGRLDVILELLAQGEPVIAPPDDEAQQEKRSRLTEGDYKGRLLAHWAAEKGHGAVITALAVSTDPAVRASLTARNRYGQTPEELARQHGHPGVMYASSPESVALARAVKDLGTAKELEASNLLIELQCPVLGDIYASVGAMRPVYLLKAGEGADAGTRMQPCMSAAAAEGQLLTLAAGQKYAQNPYSREPADGFADAVDQVQLLRQIARAYERQPENLLAARVEALAAYAAHAHMGAGAAGRAPANAAAAADAEAPAPAAVADYRQVLASTPPPSPSGAAPVGTPKPSGAAL